MPHVRGNKANDICSIQTHRLRPHLHLYPLSPSNQLILPHLICIHLCAWHIVRLWCYQCSLLISIIHSIVSQRYFRYLIRINVVFFIHSKIIWIFHRGVGRNARKGGAGTRSRANVPIPIFTRSMHTLPLRPNKKWIFTLNHSMWSGRKFLSAKWICTAYMECVWAKPYNLAEYLRLVKAVEFDLLLLLSWTSHTFSAPPKKSGSLCVQLVDTLPNFATLYAKQ